jgi:hypothetical protein
MTANHVEQGIATFPGSAMAPGSCQYFSRIRYPELAGTCHHAVLLGATVTN